MPDPVVPNVIGLTQSEAEEKLRSVSLVVGTVTTGASATMTTGSGISANPPPGTLVSSGSSVNLEVSSGRAQVAVPNVIGLTQSEAEEKLRSVDLVIGALTTGTSATRHAARCYPF